MPQFAANLSMMYPDMDFLDRFEAAAKDGFKAVEYLFPYAYPAQELAARLKGPRERGSDDGWRRGRGTRAFRGARIAGTPAPAR